MVGNEAHGDDGAEGVADVDNLGGGLVGGDGGMGSDELGRGEEGAVAGEEGELSEDLDLEGDLDGGVGVGLGGAARAEAVVGEDGVSFGEGGVDVGILFGLDLGVPVSVFGGLLVSFV